jgi:hypothetical protein
MMIGFQAIDLASNIAAEEQSKFWVALIAAFSSLIVAIFTQFSSRRNQREIENLRDRLDAARADRNAKRDYEYEARKRLYHECGPSFFQLMELSEAAYYRITGLAKTASEGNLNPGENSFLTYEYYRISTLYRLFAVPAALKIIQRRLAIVDLSLDRKILRQYTLAREAFFSFGEEFTFAKLGNTPLLYKPFDDEADRKSRSQPAIYWRQGLPLGVIEPAVEALLIEDNKHELRVRTYPECEAEYKKKDSQLRRLFDELSFLIQDFHPRTRPIFWRIMVTQACLYRALSRPHNLDANGWSIQSLHVPEHERADFDWRSKADVAVNDTTVFEPLRIAELYLQKRLASRLSLDK